MKITVIGIDLAKEVFQIHAANNTGSSGIVAVIVEVVMNFAMTSVLLPQYFPSLLNSKPSYYVLECHRYLK